MNRTHPDWEQFNWERFSNDHPELVERVKELQKSDPQQEPVWLIQEASRDYVAQLEWELDELSATLLLPDMCTALEEAEEASST